MTSNGKAIVNTITREEFETGMEEQVANIIDVMHVVNVLKKSLNIQAEVLGCHRYILEKFVPGPLLEQAAKDYKSQREAIIAAEESGAPRKTN